MPLIDFVCTKCGEVTEELFKMTEEYTPPPCQICEGETVRSWTLGDGVTSGDKERISTALGVDPSQIADGSVFRVHPGAIFNHRGDMILKNRTEQKQRLKERGWVNRDGND